MYKRKFLIKTIFVFLIFACYFFITGLRPVEVSQKTAVIDGIVDSQHMNLRNVDLSQQLNGYMLDNKNLLIKVNQNFYGISFKGRSMLNIPAISNMSFGLPFMIIVFSFLVFL